MDASAGPALPSSLSSTTLRHSPRRPVISVSNWARRSATSGSSTSERALHQPAEARRCRAVRRVRASSCRARRRASPGPPAIPRSRRRPGWRRGILTSLRKISQKCESPIALRIGPHLDAGCRHVEQEVGDALPLRGIRVGAGQQQTPVGVHTATGPELLAVDDEVRRRRVRGRGAQAARSEPASGSENPCTQISPSRIAGRCRRRCSSVPATSSVDAAWWMPTKASTSRGASWAASSW